MKLICQVVVFAFITLVAVGGWPGVRVEASALAAEAQPMAKAEEDSAFPQYFRPAFAQSAVTIGRVRVSVLVCPGAEETTFSVREQLINVDVGRDCHTPTAPIRLTFAGPSGEETSYETTGEELDLPFGRYTITEEASGASTSFELRPNEKMPAFCNHVPGCAWVIVVPDEFSNGSSVEIAPTAIPTDEVAAGLAEFPPEALLNELAHSPITEDDLSPRFSSPQSEAMAGDESSGSAIEVGLAGGVFVTL